MMKASWEVVKVFMESWWWLYWLDVGKDVEMYVPRETDLLSKVSPSYEELSPLSFTTAHTQ